MRKSEPVMNYLSWRADKWEQDGQEEESIDEAEEHQGGKDVEKVFDDKVEIGKCQHDDAEQSWNGSVNDWRHHQLEGHLSPAIASADAGDEADQDVDGEVDSDADGHDENDGRSRAQLDTQQSQDAKEFQDHGGQYEDGDSGGPDAH